MQVPGIHNLWNLCGAIAGVLLLDGECPPVDTIQAAAEGFGGLPSRCRQVGERDGITFVDDALASNPFATIASIDAFPGRELTLILGGADRGVDPSDLVEAIAAREPVPRVVVLPPEPGRLVDGWCTLLRGPGRSRRRMSPPDIEKAVRLATSVTPAGGDGDLLARRLRPRRVRAGTPNEVASSSRRRDSESGSGSTRPPVPL